MPRHRAGLVVVLLVGMLMASAPAFADITAFLGLANGKTTQSTRGVAVGAGLLIVAFEFEYCDTSEETADGAPHSRTGMFNALIQTPVPIAGIQFYGTAGGGLYNQELLSLSETSVGINLGAGAKINLIGPLRLRVDYRVFKLSGSPIGSDTLHRFYIGANVKF
jgi:hypothetical protein